jgi:DNA ligase-1
METTQKLLPFQTLYLNNRQWTIEVIDNIIRTTYGIKNGKMTIKEIIKEEAYKLAKNEWTKKIKQGYSINEFSNINDNININLKIGENIKPMLALEMEEKLVKFPVFVQPKLDGIRCLIYKKDGQIMFQSRQNKLFDPFLHLLPELNLIFDKHDIILDGELYCHGLGFESVTSMVRRAKTKHPDVDKLNYVIYDCINNLNVNYEERMKLLSPFKFKNVFFINTAQITNMKGIEDAHMFYTKDGYEGVMIRGNGPYKHGRSKDLLKYKKFLDKEYEVVSHHEGTGTHAGTPIFICKLDKSNGNKNDKSNKTFNVTMNGPMEKRREMMKHVSDYYGKMLTVKYQELSNESIPRFPIGIAFRDYE